MNPALVLNGLPLYLLATAAALALEAYAYWHTMRGWPPEARVFAFALGCASVLLPLVIWAVGLGGPWAAAAAITFLFFAAGGLGTGLVFAHQTWQDRRPAWLFRQEKGRRGDGKRPQ